MIEANCFHLNNKMANRKRKLYIDNELFRHNYNSKYPDVTLHSLRKYLENTLTKLRTQASHIIALRCSVLGLVDMRSGYCELYG